MRIPNWFMGFATWSSGVLVRNRHRLPKFANRLIDDVAKNPDGIASRIASIALGGTNTSQIPVAAHAPDSEIRLYIGPTNYAGQGYLWARALTARDSRVGAMNMAVSLPGGFSFDADEVVPVAVYNRSGDWQRAEFEAVKRFSHVLFEAERPLFGRLFGRDVAREVDALQRADVSCAFMCHGTDIRSPRTHAQRNRWSPFDAESDQTRALQADADANLALLTSQGLPVFVSTPDLLIDVPWARWCPVVVDTSRWAVGRPLFSTTVPVVAHIPSMSAMKGTHLIEPILRRLHEAGTIEYRRFTGVSAHQMPALIGDADIVLDQFRIGSYGVAACEAMSAGRLVIGHVGPDVRQRVTELAGTELAIVEADPDNLENVLLRMISAPEAARAAAASGVSFVNAVHSGAMSALVLQEHWLGRVAR